MIHELTAAGHSIEVRLTTPILAESAPTGLLPAGCTIRSLRNWSQHAPLKWLSLALKPLRAGHANAWIELGALIGASLWADLVSGFKTNLRRRTTYIGVDSRGAILAWISAVVNRRPNLYLSLELNAPAFVSRILAGIYRLEGRALRRAEALLIQDDDRRRSLAAYQSSLPKRTFFLPNSPSGGTSSDSDQNFFRDKFRLDAATFPCVALMAGMINELVYSLELAAAFAPIENVALVFHDRVRRDFDDPHLGQLRARNSKNLFLSIDPVPFDQIDRVYASATIGMAFYRPIDANFSQIALASGKLAFYLKHGLPVLMSNLSSLVALNERYRIGQIIADPADSTEIAAAIREILSRLEFYRSNARQCFAAEFDFRPKFEPVLRYLTSL